MNSQLEKIFMKVQKPGRYTGGELNSIVKDLSKVDFRFAFCFPDLYEVGMSHLGMKILYSLYNREENMWCERVFAPDTGYGSDDARRRNPSFWTGKPRSDPGF